MKSFVRFGTAALTVFIVFLFVGSLPAATGISTMPAKVSGTVLLVADSSCPTDTYAASALSALHVKYTQISESQLKSTKLSKYSVLYVSTLNLDYQACANVVNDLKSDKGAITSWLKSGTHGIVAEDEIDLDGSPLAVAFSWLPSPLTVTSQYQGAYGNNVTIIKNTGATKGLTSGDLSGWDYSFHCQVSSGKYTTLVDGDTGSGNMPITVSKQIGSKGTVLVTCQDPAVAYQDQGINYGGTLLVDMLTTASKLP